MLNGGSNPPAMAFTSLAFIPSGPMKSWLKLETQVDAGVEDGGEAIT